MKITHYDYGYLFDCVVYGKITMTKNEWEQVKQYVAHSTKQWLPSCPWVYETFKRDIQCGMKVKHGTWYNVRVPVTEAIVKKFNLKGYKRNNYVINVLD